MPTTFTSKRYRSLLLKQQGERVQFVRGSAEVPDHLVEGVDEFARSHPEFEIERGEAVEDEQPRMTAKQRVKAEAEALGLDTSGTTAEIQARIDAFDANSEDDGSEDGDDSDEDQDDSDSDESDDQSDDSDEDEAGDADSSEDDEN